MRRIDLTVTLSKPPEGGCYRNETNPLPSILLRPVPGITEANKTVIKNSENEIKTYLLRHPE